MLTSEALRYCNNRIQELTTSYDNETIQKLRNIVECLFSYLDKHDIKEVDSIIIHCWQEPVIDVEYNLAIDVGINLFMDLTYVKYEGFNITNEGSFDLHNINKLFDRVFTDDLH
jgi:hypothetical protein